MNKFERYRRRKRGEDIPILRPGPKPMDNKERFARHFVVDPSGCWLWSSYKHKFGYGKFKLWPERKDRDAHRAAWIIYRGNIPPAMLVLHKCNIPQCVNPDHLYLGTQKQNVADMDKSGRAHRPKLLGQRNPAAKLTQAQVDNMRARFFRGESIKSLSEYFKISRGHVSAIVHRHNWK